MFIGKGTTCLESAVRTESCKHTGKSTSGYIVMMNGAAVSWKSKLQSTVSLSTTEAEYIAGVEAGKEINGLGTCSGNWVGEFVVHHHF